MTATYDLDFLATDWDGAGLDLQYTAVFKEPLSQVSEMTALLPSLLVGAELERWDAVLDDGQIKADISLEPLMRLLATCAVSNLTIWACEIGVSSARFYIEIVEPDVFSIGAPSEFFYAGSNSKDMERVETILRRVENVVRRFGAFAGAFGVAEVVERLAEQAAAQGIFAEPWTRLERESVASKILKAVAELREA